jgi:hypothetical protein
VAGTIGTYVFRYALLPDLDYLQSWEMRKGSGRLIAPKNRHHAIFVG